MNSSNKSNKTVSVHTTSKKSSENSLMSHQTVDLPNTPNFNPTWKKSSKTTKGRRFAHFYKKSYFKQLSKIAEMPEEGKEDGNLVKKSKKLSKFLSVIFSLI